MGLELRLQLLLLVRQRRVEVDGVVIGAWRLGLCLGGLTLRVALAGPLAGAAAATDGWGPSRTEARTRDSKATADRAAAPGGAAAEKA